MIRLVPLQLVSRSHTPYCDRPPVRVVRRSSLLRLEKDRSVANEDRAVDGDSAHALVRRVRQFGRGPLGRGWKRRGVSGRSETWPRVFPVDPLPPSSFARSPLATLLCKPSSCAPVAAHAPVYTRGEPLSAFSASAVCYRTLPSLPGGQGRRKATPETCSTPGPSGIPSVLRTPEAQASRTLSRSTMLSFSRLRPCRRTTHERTLTPDAQGKVERSSWGRGGDGGAAVAT